MEYFYVDKYIVLEMNRIVSLVANKKMLQRKPLGSERKVSNTITECWLEL